MSHKSFTEIMKIDNVFSAKTEFPAEPVYFENRKIIPKHIYIPTKKKRTRLVVKTGANNIFLRLEDITLFYTENKIVFAIDDKGKKYIAERSLTELEQELDNTVFFRANRQYMINIDHVKSFRSYERGKLKIDMKAEELNERYYIIVSQETAPKFREWIEVS